MSEFLQRDHFTLASVLGQHVPQLCQMLMVSREEGVIVREMVHRVPAVKQPLSELTTPGCFIRLKQMRDHVSDEEFGAAIGEAELLAEVWVTGLRGLLWAHRYVDSPEFLKDIIAEAIRELRLPWAGVVEDELPLLCQCWLGPVECLTQLWKRMGFPPSMDSVFKIFRSQEMKRLALKVQFLLSQWRPSSDQLALAALVVSTAACSKKYVLKRTIEHSYVQHNLTSVFSYSWARMAFLCVETAEDDDCTDVYDCPCDSATIMETDSLGGSADTWFYDLDGQHLIPGILKSEDVRPATVAETVELLQSVVQTEDALRTLAACKGASRHSIDLASLAGGAAQLQSVPTPRVPSVDDEGLPPLIQVLEHPLCVDQSTPRGGPASSIQDINQTTTEEITHLELPATVDPAEAAAVSHQLWAGAVEQLARTAGSGMMHREESGISEEVFMFKLNRNPEELMSAFRSGLPLKDCRDSLEQAGFTFEMATGGLIFVHPWQFRACMRALIGKETTPSTIIAARSLEHLLEETLAAPGNCPRAWMKSRASIATINVEDIGSAISAIGGDDIANSSDVNQELFETNQELFETIPHWSQMQDFVVGRTFLCEVTNGSVDAVTQSTADARSSGVNPRRTMYVS